MRVISGSARRLNLVAPMAKVRPTTDRTKETLFNMINNDIPGSKILDLFAGSGALGIEALSRGAEGCWFFDNYKESIECIKINLEHTKLIEKARIFKYDYVKALETMSFEKRKFNIIFIDPPYETGLEDKAVAKISELDLLEEDGIIVIESKLRTELTPSMWPKFIMFKEKKYKTNKFTFLQKEVK